MTVKGGAGWSSRIKLWPAPLPDETLFSVVTQHHVLTRGSHLWQTMMPLFSRKAMIFAGSFPTSLGRLASYFESVSPNWTLDRLVQRFSIVPYLQFFYADKIVKRIYRMLESSDGRSIKVFLGWVASRLGASEPLRACPACFRNDYASQGRPYWHRAHQLPGVNVCHLHGIKLTLVPGPSEEYRRFVPTPPPEFIANSPIVSACMLELKFSRWSYEFLLDPPSRVDANALKEIYVGRLKEMGFATKNGRIKQKELLPWVRAQLQNVRLSLPQQSLSSFLEDFKLAWVMRLLRKPRGTIHPAKHILLMVLLFEDMKNFRERLTLAPVENDDPVKRQSNCISRRELDISVKNHALKRRPKVLSDSLLAKVICALEDGRKFTKITTEFGLSISTLYRILQQNPKTQSARRQVLHSRELKRRRNTIKQSIGQCTSIKELKNIHYKDYVWLRRHDTEWLSNIMESIPKIINVTRKRSVDWAERDDAAILKFNDAYKRLILAPGKPRRITIKSLTRGVCPISWIEKHLMKLPKSAHFLLTHVETKVAFHHRCIFWAACELASHAELVSASKVVRYAGIRWPPSLDLDEVQSIIRDVQFSQKTVRLG